VIADEADLALRLHHRSAFVRLRAIAHDVAQAPNLVDADGFDVGQNCLESRQIRVNVADQSETHRCTTSTGGGGLS